MNDKRLLASIMLYEKLDILVHGCDWVKDKNQYNVIAPFKIETILHDAKKALQTWRTEMGYAQKRTAEADGNNQ